MPSAQERSLFTSVNFPCLVNTEFQHFIWSRERGQVGAWCSRLHSGACHVCWACVWRLCATVIMILLWLPVPLPLQSARHANAAEETKGNEEPPRRTPTAPTLRKMCMCSWVRLSIQANGSQNARGLRIGDTHLNLDWEPLNVLYNSSNKHKVATCAPLSAKPTETPLCQRRESTKH